MTSAVTFIALLLGAGWLYRAAGRASVSDWGRPWLNRLDGLIRLFCRHYHRFQHDPIGLPERGAALLVSNHLSGLDPVLMITASPRPLRFLIAREEYDRRGLRWLFRLIGCIPVDRAGRPELALRAALRALEAGEVVALFPHGRIHPEYDPPPRLKGGVAWLARQVGCPVVPVRVGGMAGKGRILGAVFLRGRAWLRAYPPFRCQGEAQQDCLAGLAAILNGETSTLPPAGGGDPSHDSPERP